MPRPLILKHILYPALLAAILAQFSLQLARIAVTYKALDMGLSPAHVGLISGIYALFPAILAIPLGRLYDGGGIRLAIFLGAAGVPVALGTLLWEPASLLSLLGGMTLLGIVQGMIQSALQVQVIKASGRFNRDRVIGYHMTILGIGNMLGPLAIIVVAGLPVQMGNGLLLACLAGGLPLVGILVQVARTAKQEKAKEVAQVPMAQLLRTPRLVPFVVMSGIYVTTQDLLLVFMPVFGVERNIDAGIVGLLLGIHAVVSIGARICFGYFSALLGRTGLLMAATILAAVSMLGIASPLPLYGTALFMVGAGLSLPLALTSSVALVVEVAPKGARGTALSLRYTANRVIQFILPMLAGWVAFSIGVAGIFWALGALLALGALGVWRLMPRQRRV